MIKLRKDCTSLSPDKRVEYYDKPQEELEKGFTNGDGGHWVTIKKEGPLHGRHLFISDSGHVLAGKGIPRHVVDHLNGGGKHHLDGAEHHPKGHDPEPKAPPKPPERHEMTHREFKAANPGLHPETARIQWMSALRQAVHAGGKEAIPRRVLDAEAWLEPYIDNGWKTPRAPKEKIAGDGFPFSKEQNARNSRFLQHADYVLNHGSSGSLSEGLNLPQKEVRSIMHKDGYDAALAYLDKRAGRGYESMTLSGADNKGLTHKEYLHKLANEHKLKGEGLAPGTPKPAPAPKLPKYWAGPKDEQKHAEQQAAKLREGDHVQLAQSAMDYLHEQYPHLRGKLQDKAIINRIDKDPDGPAWHQHELSVFDTDHNIVTNQFPARARELKFHWRHGVDDHEHVEPNTVKLYHATHENNLQFGARDVKNYQSLGSWFSSDPRTAQTLYGPNVHEAHVELKNPLVTTGDTAEDFYDFFYSPTLAKKYLSKQERERWGQQDIDKLLNNAEYMTAFKKGLVKQGYDGVTFKNSTIDLNADGSEGRHDVHIAFHPEQQVKHHRRMEDSELYKSLTDLKQGPHALVIPRKVAPVKIERTRAEDLGAKHLTVYHATPTRNVSSIRQSGLIPRHGKPTQGENPAYNAVYFHTAESPAQGFDVGEPKTVLRVNIPLTSETARRLRPDEDTFYKSAAEAVKAKSSIAYCGDIPPEWIQ